MINQISFSNDNPTQQIKLCLQLLKQIMRRNPYGDTLSSEEDQGVDQQKRMRQFHENIMRIKTPLEKLEAIPENKVDEGVFQSCGSQFKEMLVKFSYVLFPRSDEGVNRLRNWDLWGPFFMTLIYGLFINNSTQFLLLFFAVFVGGTFVSFNVRLLGGHVSYFQAVAILGYCILPLFLGMIILRLLLLFTINNQLIKIIVLILAIIWCIISSRVFIAVNVPSSKKLVAMYPILLFYIFLGILLIFS